MNDLELLAELVEDLARDLRPEIEPLSGEQLAWQPGEQANSIGVTLWHMARGLDLLAIRVLQNRPAEEELWHTQGWRERTGYDPRGVGFAGWGVLTGYSWDEVLALPKLSASEVLTYLEQACRTAAAEIRKLDPEMARQPAMGMLRGRLTYYQWIKGFYKGFQAHVGEIMAIKALQAKQAKSQPE